MTDELVEAFSRLEDLVKGARRELSTNHPNNAVGLIENAMLAAQRVRRLLFVEVDKKEAEIANSKAANDGGGSAGIPPKGGD